MKGTDQKTVSLDSFVLSGGLFGLKSGVEFDPEKLAGNLIPSRFKDDKGNIELYDYVQDEIRATLGVIDNKIIKYILINLNKHYNQKIEFTLGRNSISLKSTNLDQLAAYLNESGVEWSIEKSFCRTLVLGLVNDVEIIYSLETDEVGPCIIQTRSLNS